ncbi:MAG TPA: peroxidase family protein [Bacteroidia bacterium]|nr:peroxidase family protein [Bacteroidia bacterium]
MKKKSFITSALSLFIFIITGINSNAQQQRTFTEGTEAQSLSNRSVPIVTPSALKPARSHYRTYDGTNNNLGTAAKQLWGSVNIQLFRELPPAYGSSDPKNAMNGTSRPSPREISNVLIDEPVTQFSSRDLSAFNYVWGQFLDHDMTLTPSANIESVPITLPLNETVFTEPIPFTRSQIRPGTGVTNKRQQTNLNTSWIDGSLVYGQDSLTAAWMRSHVNGKMRTSGGVSQLTLTEWNFPNNPDDAIADVTTSSNASQTVHTTGGTSALTFSVNGVTTRAAWCTGWNNGSGLKAWEIQLSTLGYSNLKLSSKQQGSNTGPRNFAIEYKIGAAGAWTPLGIPVTLTTGTWNGPTSFVLPAACANQPLVYIHWIMTSNTAINLGTVASGGSSRIDNINISGDSPGNFLPWNTITGEYADAIDQTAPGMANDGGHTIKTFVAGDVRASEHPGLLGLHTIFVREHNRFCDLLVAQGKTNDESNYQTARKYVGALIQAITYQEFLPAVGVTLSPYTQYKGAVRPDIMNTFATAGYRIGHTMVADEIALRDNNCDTVDPGAFDLIEAFWVPQLVVDQGLEPFLKGFSTHKQYETDNKINDVLRNFLFGSPNDSVRFGIDLGSLNIQRGRDHGLPDYNTARLFYTGSAAVNFSDITSDPVKAADLQTLYGNVGNIDLWVGILAEDRLPNKSVGTTMHAMLKSQFEKLRDGDYYYYLHDPWLTSNYRNQIINTTLADVIQRNTSLTSLQSNVFFIDPCPGEDGEDRISASANDNVNAADFKIYPNPANDIVNVDINTLDGPCTIKVFSTNRQLLKTVNTVAGQKTVQLNTSDFTNGLYVINISTGKGLTSLKFVKMEE